jgi:hypothetical protein
MKIQDSNVLIQSNLKVEKQHSTSLIKFEIHHSMDKVQENASKAHTATELLLYTDFRSKKVESQKALYSYDRQMSVQEQSKKEILTNLLSTFFNSGQDIYTYPANNIQAKELQNSAIVIETNEEYYQKQTIDFCTSLQINTPNNYYEMDLEVAFSQELYEAHSMELVFGDVTILDPLVINYDDDINPFENISKLKFEFDLNNDGENELIPLLKKGAGFLAYDKNENGEIDNGSELFGPSTNDGFSELAQYDNDHNNWIDENDLIFNKLKIWQINEEGDNELVSLVDLNVGAIYLGQVQSGFTYQNKIDQVDGVQKANGVYVKNDGSGIRIINALDFAIS